MKNIIDKQWCFNFEAINASESISKQKFINQKYGHYSYLMIKGVGFKVWNDGVYLNMDLGFTHYISIKIPTEIKVTIKKTRLLLFSHQKQKLFNYIYFLKEIRFPDSYKGKGIRFFNQEIKLKVGKVKN